MVEMMEGISLSQRAATMGDFQVRTSLPLGHLRRLFDY